MKASVFKGPGNFTVEEVPTPQISEGEVLLRVLACGLCGTDVKVFTNGHRAVTPPRITGHEIVGEVLESKSSAAGVASGDRVLVVAPVGCMKCEFCLKGEQNICPQVVNDVHAFGYTMDGGFAEYLRIPKEAADQGVLIPIPKTNLPATAFAVCEPLSAVINGQEKLRIGSHDTVVVIGAGPIGCMHVYLAHAKGAKRIIFADSNAERLALASGTPTDVFIDNSKEDLVARVMQETEGRGADVVIIAAPAPSLQADAIQMAAIKGRVSFFAGLAKGTPSPLIDTNAIHYREIEVYGAFGANPRHYREALQAVLDGSVDAARLITHTIPLADIAEAVRIAQSGKSVKVVVVP